MFSAARLIWAAACRLASATSRSWVSAAAGCLEGFGESFLCVTSFVLICGSLGLCSLVSSSDSGSDLAGLAISFGGSGWRIPGGLSLAYSHLFKSDGCSILIS